MFSNIYQAPEEEKPMEIKISIYADTFYVKWIRLLDFCRHDGWDALD